MNGQGLEGGGGMIANVDRVGGGIGGRVGGSRSISSKLGGCSGYGVLKLRSSIFDFKIGIALISW